MSRITREGEERHCVAGLGPDERIDVTGWPPEAIGRLLENLAERRAMARSEQTELAAAGAKYEREVNAAGRASEEQKAATAREEARKNTLVPQAIRRRRGMRMEVDDGDE